MASRASDLVLKTGFRRSEGERVHLPEKYSSSKNFSDRIVFGEVKKGLYLACRIQEKSFFAFSSVLLKQQLRWALGCVLTQN